LNALPERIALDPGGLQVQRIDHRVLIGEGVERHVSVAEGLLGLTEAFCGPGLGGPGRHQRVDFLLEVLGQRWGRAGVVRVPTTGIQQRLPTLPAVVDGCLLRRA
jgi:hypothetical protein